MDTDRVKKGLIAVREARAEFAKRQTSFTANVDTVMTRLLYEAARNKMSPDQVARLSGLTPKRIRTLMRQRGLDPRMGKRMLSAAAAEALHENAALLSVEPHEIDLMSPLAYLPMGSDLRRALEAPGATEEDLDADIVCTVPGCNCDIDYRVSVSSDYCPTCREPLPCMTCGAGL